MSKAKRDWAKEIIQWANTEEGKKELEEANSVAKQAIKEFHELIVLDPSIWDEPLMSQAAGI